MFDLQFDDVRATLLEDALFDDEGALFEPCRRLTGFQHDRDSDLTDDVRVEANHAPLWHDRVDLSLIILASCVCTTVTRRWTTCNRKIDSKVNICFYTVQYSVCWTAQSALHFTPHCKPVQSDTNSTYMGSILGMQQLQQSCVDGRPTLKRCVLR